MEAAQIVIPGYDNEALNDFFRHASARDLQEFLFLTRGVLHSVGRRSIDTADASLHIRLSEDAMGATKEFTGHVEKLTKQTDKLIRHAESNDITGRRLTRLTWALVGFSVALLVVAAVQTVIMYRQDARERAQAQHVQSGNH